MCKPTFRSLGAASETLRAICPPLQFGELRRFSHPGGLTGAAQLAGHALSAPIACDRASYGIGNRVFIHYQCATFDLFVHQWVERIGGSFMAMSVSNCGEIEFGLHDATELLRPGVELDLDFSPCSGREAWYSWRRDMAETIPSRLASPPALVPVFVLNREVHATILKSA